MREWRTDVQVFVGRQVMRKGRGGKASKNN